MLRFLADENLNRQIITGLARRVSRLDVMTVLEAGLGGARDPAVLAWAAEHDRVLLTHDHRTIPGHYYERLAQRLKCAGVILIRHDAVLSQVLFGLEMICECCGDDEMAGAFVRLPI